MQCACPEPGSSVPPSSPRAPGPQVPMSASTQERAPSAGVRRSTRSAAAGRRRPRSRRSPAPARLRSYGCSMPEGGRSATIFVWPPLPLTYRSRTRSFGVTPVTFPRSGAGAERFNNKINISPQLVRSSICRNRVVDGRTKLVISGGRRRCRLPPSSRPRVRQLTAGAGVEHALGGSARRVARSCVPPRPS